MEAEWETKWVEYVDETKYLAGFLGTYGKYLTYLVFGSPDRLYRHPIERKFKVNDIEFLGKDRSEAETIFARLIVQLASLHNPDVRWLLVSTGCTAEFDIYGTERSTR